MKKSSIYLFILLLNLIQVNPAFTQTAIGYFGFQGIDEMLNLRVISVTDAIAAGNGVMKIRLADGSVGAADLVLTSNSQASPVRVYTPYGVRSWRRESRFAFAYGGEDYDLSISLVNTSDGGFALGGYTDSWGAGGHDQMLIKTDASGNIGWTGVYGGPNSETGRSVIQRTDGGYILLGTASNYYMYLNFINSSGSSTLEGYFQPAYGYTAGYDVIQCSDGNFIGAGYYDGSGYLNDLYIKKFDINGANIWGYTYDSGGNECGYSVVQRSDGGYVAVGWIIPQNSDQDALYCLIDSAGNEENTYAIGGSGIEDAQAVTAAGDGGYVFTGKTDSYGAGGWDVYMVKKSASGSLLWSKAFGGTDADIGNDIITANDGGFAIVGRTYSFGAGQSDFWLIKTDADGNPEWSWVFGGVNYDDGYAVAQTPDGCYYITGSTWSYGEGLSDFSLVKFTPDGSACLGYALGFNSEMMPFDQPGSTFKAMKVDGLVATDLPCEEKVIHPKISTMNEKFKSISHSSRDFVSPTTTSICE